MNAVAVPFGQGRHDRDTPSSPRSEGLSWLEPYDLMTRPVNAFTPRPLDAERAPAGSSHDGVYNRSGWPGAVVPGGFAEKGLPLVVTMVGQPSGDITALAAALHSETPRRGFNAPNL